MPTGLKVIGSHGVAQIDETNKNFVVVASGSKSSGDWGVAGVSNFVQIVVTNAVNPVIAFRCTEQVALGYTSISGSTWTITLLTNIPAALSYWVFDESPATNPGNFGLEIYNAAGQRVYHSEQKPLRVVGTGAGTYASGPTYAVIRPDPGYAYTSTPTGLPFPEEYDFQGYLMSAAVNSNVISETGVQVDNSLVSPDPGSYSGVTGATLVIDVTNF